MRNMAHLLCTVQWQFILLMPYNEKLHGDVDVAKSVRFMAKPGFFEFSDKKPSPRLI